MTLVGSPLGAMAAIDPDGAEQMIGPSATTRKDKFPISSVVAPLVVLALFIGFWYMMHYWGLRFFFDKDGKTLIPTPTQVWDATVMRPIARRRYIEGVKWTAMVAFGGLLITMVLGVLMAIVLSQAKWVERAVYPYLVALQAIPILAIIPLILSVWGGGIEARFFVCFMIAFFPVVTNTLFGLNSADQGQHDLFTLRGASRFTRLWKLQLPSAMPNIFTGFRISAGLSVIGAVVGEQFFRKGSKPGVGIVMEIYRQKGIYPPVYGGLIIACMLGIATFFFFGWLGNRVVGHWHESGRKSR